MKLPSKILFFILATFMLWASLCYYPRWKNDGPESALSWDAFGYYLYLPAIFVYHDAKHLAFADSIMNKYHPSPDLQQVFKCDNGNYVDKYAIGQAVQEFPSFMMAHLLAKPLGFDADGFSLPYEFAIQLGQLIMALLGLWMLRKILLIYFADKVVSVV